MVKRACKIIAFFLIGIMLFAVVQELLIPEWNSDGAAGRMISGFMALEDNSVDVLFLGTSHVERGVSPMKIYEDQKICSYNLGSSGQPIEASYVLLKQAFRTQSPKVVFLDLSMMFEDDLDKINIYYKYVMDNLYGRPGYYEVAKIYDTLPNSDGLWTALFPVAKYHTRWNDLTEKDFVLNSEKLYYSMGQYLCVNRIPSNYELKTINSLTAQMTDVPEISDSFVEYFQRIKTLCDENGAELVLMKIPVYMHPKTHGWTYVKSGIAEKFARENGVEYLDLLFADVTDPNSDSSDGGSHLNISGAEKVGAYLADYLLQNYSDLNQNGNAAYDDALEYYDKMRNVASLLEQTDFREFIKMLINNKEDWTILIYADDDYTHGMTSADYDLMEQLGLERIRSGALRDTYAAVIEGGTVLYEECSKEPIIFEGTVNGKQINITSACFNSTILSEAVIDGEDCRKAQRGLNIIVIDNASGLLIADSNFDTWSPEKTAVIDTSRAKELFRSYEQSILSYEW